jgi:hypothetical protein
VLSEYKMIWNMCPGVQDLSKKMRTEGGWKGSFLTCCTSVCPKFSARSKNVIGGKPEKRTIGPPTAIGGTLLSGAMEVIEVIGMVIGTIIDVMIMLDATAGIDVTRTVDIYEAHTIEMIGTTDTEMIGHTTGIGTATATVIGMTVIVSATANALEPLRHKHAVLHRHPPLRQ